MREEIGMEGISQPCSNLSDEVCQEKMWRPSRGEILKRYEINIRFHSSGCVISIGCQSVAFSDITEGIAALNDYITNPYESQKLWEEKFNKEQ